MSYWLRARSMSPIATRFVLWLGGTAFGVYLIENIPRGQLRFVYDALFPSITRFFAAWVWVVCATLAAAVIVTVLKQVPVLRRLL
jgi:hypothetical protein